MASPASTALGYNVDALAACGPGRLVAGLSNFTGPRWTGAVAVMSAPADATTPPRLEALVELRAGAAAVAVLPLADEFTGRTVVATGSDEGGVDLWYLTSSGSSSSGGTGGSSSSTAPGPLQHAQAQVLHDGCVAGLAAAPGSAQLASGSADGTVRLWDCGQLLACTGQLGGSSGTARGGINAVAWTADPAVLASVGDDGRLCLRDTRQLGGTPAATADVGAPALSLVAAPAAAPSSSQLGSLLVVGDQRGRVSLFDTRNCSQPLQQRQLHGDAVHSLAATSGGSRVASGGDDGAVLLLDCASLEGSRQLAPARREGEVPCYVRALSWCGSGSGSGNEEQVRLYRGGWDQAVAAVPLV